MGVEMSKTYECKCGAIMVSPEELEKCMACGKKNQRKKY